MITTLYRGGGPLAWLACWLLLLGLAQSAQASHLLGGEMTYRYLDANGPAAAPLRYELTVAVYNNCTSSVLNDFATVGIYDRATGNKLALTTVNFPTINDGSLDIPQTSLDACVTPTIPPGCTILGNSQAFRLQKFVGVVNLPATTQGFYAFWTAYARNLDITNLFDPGNQYMSLYCTLAPPALANHSPVFVNKAVANLCANDTTYILNNAVDADGDQLVYSLGQPYGSDIPASFSGLPALLGYNAGAGYAPTTPLGTATGNYSSINAATGIAKFRTTAALNNKFAVAIDVREYRTINGQQVLIGITRRDVQLVVVTCPVTPPPVLPTNAPVNPIPRTYTVEAGGTLTIPLSATQANGHPLTMTLSSVLLDGAGGYDATFAGNAGTLIAGSPVGTAATSSATSPVAGTFVYKPACTDARATPYDISLMVEDKGCAGQTVGDVLRITVVKPTGPSGITGSAAVCGLNTPQSYTATGGTAPNVSWTATGGTIIGSPTANPVQVQWPAAGTYTLVAQGVTQYGCLTGPVTKTVVVSPLPTLAIAGNQTICQGSSTTLTVTGGTAPYTLAGGAAPVSGAGPFVLSPTQTTTYTVTDAGSACAATGQVAITVNAKPVANAGAPAAVCAGGTAQLGAAPVAGYSYSWSPATGLSSASIANPTVTLPNNTASPLTQTYTLTVTNAAGCTSTSTVAVTVNPLPVAAPGPAVAICSGGTGQLGSAPVAGLTYSWSPAAGLSNASLANPIVTLTTTGAASTQLYTLTVTSAAGCTSTGTVAVTVNPLPVANAGAAVAFCSGGSAQLGAAPVAGFSYSWSPATGLSNPASANPTVTLTNVSGAASTQTYTLSVTSASGCTSTGTVAVTVNPLPVAAPGAAVAICSGGTGQLGSAPVAGNTYQWSPATGLNNVSIANPTVTLTNSTGAASTQLYNLTVASAAGCTSTGTVAVTVNPLPVANAGAAVAFCSGGSAQLGSAAVAGLTYSWNPATGLNNASIANPTVTLPNNTALPLTQLYTLTVTSAAGCTSTGTVTVTVNPLPVAAPGAAVAICSGGTGQLGSAPVAGHTYSWSPATGLSNASLANPTVTLSNATGTATTQTYTLTVTDAATSCTSTGTVVVTVNPLPVAAPGAALAICSGSTGQLGSAPVAGNTYQWSPATGLNNAIIANPTVTLTTTGAASTQLYTLTVTSAAGCTSTGTVDVTVNPLPAANAGATVAFCSGGSAQLGSAAVPGNTYSWSPTTGLSNPAAAAPTVTLTNATSAAATQTYTLTVTNNATGCVAAATVAVTVQPLPVATAGATVAICAGGTGQLGAAPVAGLTYSWSPTAGLSNATIANPTVTLPNATASPLTQSYTLTVTNASNCVSTSTVAVTVLPLPVVAPGAAITICSGGVGQLGASQVAGFSYSWSPATGLSSATVANPTVTLTNATGAASTQTYTLTVTSASGCLGTGTVAVTVTPAVVPGAIGTSQTICAGSVPAPLTSAVPASGGTGTYTYQWEISTDNSTWQAITNATGLSYAPGALARTAHFRRRAIGTCGAALTNAVTIQVQPLLVPAVALPTLPAQCAGTAFTFTPVPANAGAAPTYQWLVNGVAVGTGPAYTSSTLADGDQVQVVLTPTAGFCASGTATATARVSLTPTPAPTLTIVAQTTMPVCAGTPIRFSLGQATALGANPQYQWQVDGVNVAGATSSVFTSTALRNGQAVTLVLRTTNACGQPATATSGAVRVVLNPSVRLSAGPNKTIMEGESVELEGTADGSYPVVWTPTATLAIGSNPLRPKASPTATTTYTLAAGAGYCADPSTVTVTVTRRIRIPNAFTPNADNNDDTWQIEGIEDYPANHVLIVNRWGGKIFEASGYSRATEWKGTINGEPAPIGTYYYVLTLGNGKSYTGPLTIVY